MFTVLDVKKLAVTPRTTYSDESNRFAVRPQLVFKTAHFDLPAPRTLGQKHLPKADVANYRPGEKLGGEKLVWGKDWQF